MSSKRTTGKTGEKKTDRYGMSPDDWARLDAMTDEEVEAAALSDPDCPPTSPERLARMRRISPAKFTREQVRMTRGEFATAYGIPEATLEAWERHEAEPDAGRVQQLRHASVG